jgi:hypothetical protein
MRKLAILLALLWAGPAFAQTQATSYFQLSQTPNYLANGGPGFVQIDAGGHPFIAASVPGSGTVTNAANLANNAMVVGDGGGAGIKTVGGSIGGSFTTGGAISFTGAASGSTFALPAGGPFTFTYPLASSTLASLAGVETFTNKTINGAALAGTFSGTPTFSGVPKFTGLSAGTQVSCMGLDSSNNLVLLLAGCSAGGGGSVSVTAATPDTVITPSPGTGTFTVGSTLAQNIPTDGGSHSYTVLSSDITKEISLVSTFTTLVVPQATGSFGVGTQFIACNSGAVTATSTTSTINGIAGATGIKLGALSCSRWFSSNGQWIVQLGVPTDPTQRANAYLAGDGTYSVPAGSGGLTIGTTTITSGTTTRVLFDNAGVLGEYTISGTGNVAMTTSPTFTTPALGTPSALVGTNITGTAAGLTAGTVTTNANLTGPVTSVGNATAIANGAIGLAKIGGEVDGNCIVGAGGVWTAGSCSAGGSVSVTAATPDIVITPSPGLTTFTIGSTLAQNIPTDGGSHSYTVVSGDITKEISLVSTFTAAVIPQATTTFGAGTQFTLCNSGAITATSTTSTINGIAGATGIKLGALTCSRWFSSSGQWIVLVGVATDPTQRSTAFLAGDGTYSVLPTLSGTNTWSGTQTFGSIVGTVVARSGTTDTLAAGDCGKTIEYTSASAVTVTAPNSLVIGCHIAIVQGGAGQVTISAGASATLVSAHSYTKTFGQSAGIGLSVIENAGGSAAKYFLFGDGA